MSALGDVLEGLSPIQREAVCWSENAVLVLAGPGAGKTRVLTARIARILDESRDRKFRILALTFTTKAASEMRDRVDQLVPGLVDRTFIGTFHAFCTQLLRQHGSHLGQAPDFEILNQDSDREAVLQDALIDAVRGGESVSAEDTRWLKTIDELKARLILPEKAASRLSDPRTGVHVARVYALYERALQERNCTDFNGLILGACRLLRDVPGVAERTRRSYPYWLLDEFQDTSPAQYRLLQLAAGTDFKNVFAVADDDQIIYQWAGASYRQIVKYRTDFEPQLIQLVENHRCPAEIVTAGNLLVRHNSARTPEKLPLVAAKPAKANSIELRVYEDDVAEAAQIADEIAKAGSSTWGRTAVLGRTRAMLAPIQEALRRAGAKAVIAQRRDQFISPQFAWLQACLSQSLRPTDVRVFRVLVDAANRMLTEEFDPDILMAEAQAGGLAYTEQWARTCGLSSNPLAHKLAEYVERLANSRTSWRAVVREAVPTLVEAAATGEDIVSDAEDDRAAWTACLREIRAEKGAEPDLDEVIQGLALRSKEPPRDPSSVTLLTVHSAKGLEFDLVYVVGLAESVMPSWQSAKKGDASPEMEEERRNCFVAVTRTKERLVLSRAARYRGWAREPSRFLGEMGLLEPARAAE